MATREMLENRLRKNLARLGPWARRERVGAWRLYDRDIPEIPYAIDRYGPRVLVSEYVTPVAKRRSPAEREAEHTAVIAAVAAACGVDGSAITLKARERHVSAERRAAGHSAREFEVEEHGLRFLVNLDDYLDTGLFLDHRAARKCVGGLSEGRRVLNLFCYTGAFTVHAASGGAAFTESVDLSPTYLAWAGRNFALNGLDPASHRLVRADVQEHLRASRATFDVIVLDPPTLSRSASGRSFDVQQAYPELVRLCAERLAPDGLLLFSTNFRQFRMDAARLPGWGVREVTQETTPPDFREGLHRAFELRRTAGRALSRGT